MGHVAWRLVCSGALLTAVACAPSTGGGTLTFDAFAAGPEALEAAGEYEFVTQAGYRVTLTQATLRVGAVYLNQQVPLAGGAARDCFLPGVYVAEVTDGATVDLLDPRLQPFGAPGRALLDPARTAEVWLLGEGTEIDAEEDGAVIFEAAGTATRATEPGAEEWPFTVSLSIGSNWRRTPTDPKKPGDNPICRERIVSPIPVDLSAAEGYALELRIDPALFFRRVDFSQLPESARGYRFSDAPEDQPSLNLYRDLHGTGAYQLRFTPQ
ncbi:MAG: hypothetical protein KF915_08795 [Polyangiaceae bacterium]|nr:hypothetical protein [Polyangiaceae bacterium]